MFKYLGEHQLWSEVGKRLEENWKFGTFMVTVANWGAWSECVPRKANFAHVWIEVEWWSEKNEGGTSWDSGSQCRQRKISYGLLGDSAGSYWNRAGLLEDGVGIWSIVTDQLADRL